MTTEVVQQRAIQVEVTNHPAQHPPVYRGRYTTFTLTANDPVQCILPEDDTRVEAYVLSVDNDVVIGTRTQVQAALNTDTSTPFPQGAYIPKAMTAPLRVVDGNALYAGVTTTASNSRVSVAAYYRD